MCKRKKKSSILKPCIHDREKRLVMLEELDITHNDTICEIDDLIKKFNNDGRTSKRKD